MKKIISAILIIAIFTTALIPSAFAEIRTTGDYGEKIFDNFGYYLDTVNGVSEVQIVGYYGTGPDVVIPEQIENATVTSFRFTDAQYTVIKSLTIGKNIKSLQSDSFTIPSKAVMTTITVDADNTAYKSVDNVLYDKGMTRLIYAGKDVQTLTLPATIKTIQPYAFYKSKIKTVAFNSALNTIQKAAFAYCQGLTSVSLNGTMLSIGQRAFQGCYNLKLVTLGTNVTSIFDLAFYGCNFVAINIPVNVSIIRPGALAVKNLKNITISPNNHFFTVKGGIVYTKTKKSIVFAVPGRTKPLTTPKTVTTICKNAFMYSNITKIVLSKYVKNVGDAAFQGSKLSIVKVLRKSSFNFTLGTFMEANLLRAVYFTARPLSNMTGTFKNVQKGRSIITIHYRKKYKRYYNTAIRKVRAGTINLEGVRSF